MILITTKQNAEQFKKKRIKRTTNLQKGLCVINTILPTTPKEKKNTPSPQRSNKNKQILHHIVHRRPQSKQQCIWTKKTATPPRSSIRLSKGSKFDNPLKKWTKPRKQNLILIEQITKHGTKIKVKQKKKTLTTTTVQTQKLTKTINRA